MNDVKKPYSEMTPAERLADRIAKNRVIDAKVEATKKRLSVVRARHEKTSLVHDLNVLYSALPEKDREGFLDILKKYPDFVRVK